MKKDGQWKRKKKRKEEWNGQRLIEDESRLKVQERRGDSRMKEGREWEGERTHD